MDALVDFKAATHMAAEAWKAADAETKAHYEALASNEKDAYEAALKVYKRHKEEHSSWGAAQPPERRGSHDAASVSNHTLFISHVIVIKAYVYRLSLSLLSFA